MRLPKSYADNHNSSDITVAAPVTHTKNGTFLTDNATGIRETLEKQGKYQWMGLAGQYTYNCSNEVGDTSITVDSQDDSMPPLESDSEDDSIPPLESDASISSDSEDDSMAPLQSYEDPMNASDGNSSDEVGDDTTY